MLTWWSDGVRCVRMRISPVAVREATSRCVWFLFRFTVEYRARRDLLTYLFALRLGKLSCRRSSQWWIFFWIREVFIYDHRHYTINWITTINCVGVYNTFRKALRTVWMLWGQLLMSTPFRHTTTTSVMQNNNINATSASCHAIVSCGWACEGLSSGCVCVCVF